LLDNPAIDA
jgi:hypothetical protein